LLDADLDQSNSNTSITFKDNLKNEEEIKVNTKKDIDITKELTSKNILQKISVEYSAQNLFRLSEDFKVRGFTKHHSGGLSESLGGVDTSIQEVKIKQTKKNYGTLKNTETTVIIEQKKTDMKSLSEIIARLNHDKDLNSVVSVVNEVLLNEKKKLFNIEDLDIYLSSNELDKFSQQKKMMYNFYVRINYSLQGKIG